MFEIGRELRRFFAPERPRDGLSLGDAALLELLDIKLLTAEARSADVAAGRIGVRDRALRQTEASAVWRELGRRTGDLAALRKAAALAEQAAGLARESGRARMLERAICAQAEAALASLDLYADEGLFVAVEFLLKDGGRGTMVRGLKARLAARRVLAGGDLAEVKLAASAFDRVLGALKGRDEALAAARLRAERADVLTGAGARLHQPQLIEAALSDLAKAAEGLDEAYHPLSLARVHELRAMALLRLGEERADLADLLDGVEALDSALELTPPDHSPMDWARLQHGRGLLFNALGEAGASDVAFDKALAAYGKALAALKLTSGAALHAVAVQDRAACLVRRAEAAADPFALDEAEAALRGELAAVKAPLDPLAWAVLQLNLARVYIARLRLGGPDRGERARAGDALASALDVFGERGLHRLAVQAQAGLQALREMAVSS